MELTAKAYSGATIERYVLPVNSKSFPSFRTENMGIRTVVLLSPVDPIRLVENPSTLLY